ncbi:MAG: VCBS repeat-containing protein [Phycisphaera sp.]|nr:MAG: VCBS repeat-containing protein [Phycisphaera sp.]
MSRSSLVYARYGTRYTACVASSVLSLAIAAGAAAQCDPADSYGVPNSGTSGDLPLGVGTGDVNNDGNLDVVTGDFFGNSVSILLGNGDGTLQAGVVVPLTDTVSGFSAAAVPVKTADLNGDGWADIVAGVQSPDLGNPGIAVLINDGTGAFTSPPEFYAFSTQIRGLEILDLTGDGNLDVVYANRDDDTINVVPGNGDGTFGSEAFFDVTGGPVGVAIADFNNDGNQDVATPLVFSSEIAILAGDGAGNLTELARYPANSPEGIAVGDINGDGNEDLVIPFLNGDAVEFILGNGDGTFGSTQSISTGSGSLPIAIALGDVNGDGFDDIHAGLFIAGNVQVLRSNGDGTFQAGVDFPVGARPRDFAFGDFNGDGANDLAAANGATSGTATVILNGCGGVQPCLADVNGDGAVTPTDFTAWVNAFNNNLPECDQNGDGACTPTDFTAWVNNFNAGC